ncbi:hypothetical protein K491DRAFT_123603 [Lophiostoma macrostomum CBS 122681]|uniref:Uncharacterized protein n=1 Tax=Lophiostoma macrostomum CBS 122681 TaxID=1314788 RepID=A0A6A6TMZ1_9PLEO|nr:hypothetical protein K491DRAFT_123603 [Lophiostoma macrostomum CBS 122681]
MHTNPRLQSSVVSHLSKSSQKPSPEKQTPLSSTSVPQMHVLLVGPHARRKPQVESQGGRVQTPFVHVLPSGHLNPHPPQFCTSVPKSTHVPSQSSTLSPPQGVEVGDSELVVFVGPTIVVVGLSDVVMLPLTEAELVSVVLVVG